jgi:hypothetical protein
MKLLAICLTFIATTTAGFCGALQLSVTTDKDRVAPGHPVTWSVLLSNSSASAENGIELRVTLPDGLDNGYWNGWVEQQFFNPDPNPASNASYESGSVVTYQTGTLAAGESRLYQVTVFPMDDTADGSQFTLMAQADSDSPSAFVSSQKSVSFLASPTSLALGGGALPLVKGVPLSLNASFGHDGSQPLPGASLEIPLPEGVSVSSASAGWRLSGNLLIWDLGTMRKGDNGQRTCSLVYQGNSPAGTPVTWKASLKSNGSTRIASEWPSSVAVGEGLRVTVSSTVKQVLPGQPVTWSVLLSNPLNYAATGVKLRINLPTGMDNGYWNGWVEEKFFNPDPNPASNASYEHTQTVLYAVGTLAAGASRLYQVKVFPMATAADRRQFSLSAQADSDNGMAGSASRASVTFGAFIPVVPEIAVESPVGVDLKDNQATAMSFGRISKLNSKSKSFRIINTGNATLDQLQISKSGPHAKDWTISRITTRSLATGQHITFNATFRPGGKGPRSATIVIRSNDPNENPFEIRVSGRGL